MISNRDPGMGHVIIMFAMQEGQQQHMCMLEAVILVKRIQLMKIASLLSCSCK